MKSGILTCIIISAVALVISAGSECRFAKNFECSDFYHGAKIEEYLNHVTQWEGKFAQPGVGYDSASGYSYDGHPLDYQTGELYGEPHTFSAPSKECVHVGLLALALSGNHHALRFTEGFEKALDVLELKMDGYEQFNKAYPGYGCFTPWVGFNANGTFTPLESWSTPYYKVPGLDNGEWFWALYAVANALENAPQTPRVTSLATRYRAIVDCQKANAKTVFYRGNGDVSAVVNILNAFIEPTVGNYEEESGLLNDPYEGETMTQLIYLFGEWESEEERNQLWVNKRGLFQKLDYTVPDSVGAPYAGKNVTVQEGFWFSTHEQWKALLLPYYTPELDIVRRVFRNAEVVRTFDAYASGSPGLLASINDVTDGSEDIPDYISAAGIPGISWQEIDRRDVITPYGSFSLMLHNLTAGLCWYNNMLRGPRMQSKFGSTEAINVNGTEISPLTTWDSKITTVLGMLGGVGPIVQKALMQENDVIAKAVAAINTDKDNNKDNNKDLKLFFSSSYERFVYVVKREHEMLFGTGPLPGEDFPLMLPSNSVPSDQLSDWELSC